MELQFIYYLKENLYALVWNPTCLPAYLPTCLPAYLPTCLPAYLPTCLPAYLPTCLPAYLPTYHEHNQSHFISQLS
eukprot:scaffold34673_cov175-Amphora_coffeaeformis.AAC.1